tara:strand:+ start:22915 stop:23940 length:1026 start_codon:yes stop_codon:yes gene_type:complete
MSWAAVAASAISAGVGIYQTQKGKKLAEQAGERPEFEIPGAVKSALGTSQLKSLQGIPGAVKSEMLQEMDRSRMASLKQVNERRGGLGVVSQLDQNQQDSIRKMGIMDIQQREKNVQGLQDMRMKMAGYQEKQQADTLAAWGQESQAAAAMQGAGMQNIAGAVTSLGMAAASRTAGGGGKGSKKRQAYQADIDAGTVGENLSFKDWKGERKSYQGDYKSGVINESLGFKDWRGYNKGAQQYTDPGLARQDKLSLAGMNMGTDATYLQGQSPKINPSTLKTMGFGGGPGYNESMFSNIGLASELNTFELNSPSVQNQLFGVNNTGVGSDDWKSKYPSLYENQ